MGILDKIIGTYSERQIKKLTPTVDKIEALAETYKKMTEEELKAQTPILKERLKKGETLDDILPEAFASCGEADDRVLGKRPFRVQLIGGIVLHQGRIAEMKTGEGKTLVATLPAYLNALTGEGVHIVTVNEYLARMGYEEMGRVYGFLGLTTGLILHEQTKEEKRAAYACDITYTTNNEIGFDYLPGQHGALQAEPDPAGFPLRHRGRGGLDPHRRSRTPSLYRDRAIPLPIFTKKRTPSSAGCGSSASRR